MPKPTKPKREPSVWVVERKRDGARLTARLDAWDADAYCENVAGPGYWVREYRRVSPRRRAKQRRK